MKDNNEAPTKEPTTVVDAPLVPGPGAGAETETSGVVAMTALMEAAAKRTAQDSEIAPTGQLLETGAGFSLPVSKVVLCSSVLASLVVFMLK
ncbi:hypothetical protein QL285_001969 [Trifolium repens]|nr:hypothetical protein QL285_001969 [Trifolium repens]